MRPVLLLLSLTFGADDVHPGLRHLLETPYIPSTFDDEIVANLWRVWEEPARSAAAAATPEQRREMTYDRYGLTAVPGRELPLQYTRSGASGWSINCLACHGGQVAGRVIPGLGNAHFAMESLAGEVFRTKLLLGRPLHPGDFGAMTMPMGTTVGTTNAVVFGVVLGAARDPHLNPKPSFEPPPLVHHDMDAPPWWHLQRKTHMYLDGFTPKGHRDLMQFMLVHPNGPEEFAAWEDDFRAVYDYIHSLTPPEYPFEIDRDLAARGESVFRDNCAECHGTKDDYPERTVPLAEIGTDPVRYEALSPELRRDYLESWFGEQGTRPIRLDPGGYVAPPLDGIWATAPYLHNGSVPTLWHLLHPPERPAVWRRVDADYDADRVGLAVTTAENLPASFPSPHQRRTWFDTRRPGKSAAGHDFPAALTESERRELLEYLKTL